MATPELAPELAPILPKAEPAVGSDHDSDHAADAPSTPCQKPSNEPAPTYVPKKYSTHQMLAINQKMSLPQLTATPCWSTDPSDTDGVWSGVSCFAAKEDVLANLGTVRSLLVKKRPTDRAAHPRFPQHSMSLGLEIPASVIDPNWTLAQKAAALAACHAYQAATLAAASLRPIQTRTSYSSSGPQPTTPFSRPADRGFNSARMPPFQHQHQAGGATTGFGPSAAMPTGPDKHVRAEPMPARANSDSFRRSESLNDSHKPSSFTRSNSTATATEASCPQETLFVGPGRGMWEQGIRKLLGPHGDSSSSWLVQFPHITGTMGPISAEDMEKWLLHGVPPRQMGRAVHRPVLEATAADPASLLVCALLPGELERNMKPGQNAFVPLRSLLYGLSMGLDYSCVTKGLVDNRHPGSTPAQSKQRQGGHAAADTCGQHGADQAPQPDTPTTPSSKDFKDYLGRRGCSAQLLVSRLQHMPADQMAGMTAAADEIAGRAHKNTEDREALVREGAVGALVRVLQLSPATGPDADQAHTVCLTATCWALHCLLGRTKQAPHGCSHAQAALTAANATKHLTKVILTAWQADGGTSKDNESPAGSPVSELQQGFGPLARLQKAAAVVLAGLATTPEGKQAILQEGTISCIVRLLGSLCAEVSAAALSVVRNLSTPEDSQIHKTLFKLGVFNMLVHVVARHKDPAVKQNALRVLLDLASAALSSPSTSPVKAAGPSSTVSNTAPAGASSDKANEYTAGNAVDRLVKRGLPAVLLKLLHKDAPVALQTRAIMVLQLMAVHKPLVVLSSIKDLVEYEQVAEGQEEQRIAYNGVQVLQRLMQSSTSDKVQAGALELLQALTDTGLIGRAGRGGKQVQAVQAEAV